MNDPLLLTLVDYGKPFKGTWRIYQKSDNRYAACHAPAAAGRDGTAQTCQVFRSTRQVCRFAELLQFHGWSIEGHGPGTVQFVQACAL